MSLTIYRPAPSKLAERLLTLNCELAEKWLVEFLRDEVVRRRKMTQAVIGLSGGIDSALSAALAAKAFGPENVTCIRMPYKLSSNESLSHAEEVAMALGVNLETIPITDMVDGFVCTQPEIDGTRLGNVCARCRMVILFDQAARLGGLPIGTGNKTERFFGYYTWHADDSPPINPLGDLFKSQVWALSRYMSIPESVVNKAPTADLVKGQTDEGDFGISYRLADEILALLTYGLSKEQVVDYGYHPEEVALVFGKVARTHWKRRMPTVAMLSDSAINEYFLRPVDF
ncbi:MAG: NAD+ synthase [Fimbriimonadaceae bacterium]|nr:NAD+ synthase [Fimbriimonadaceae bacterium]